MQHPEWFARRRWGSYESHRPLLGYAAFFLDTTFFLVAAFFAITFFSTVFTAGFFRRRRC